MAAALDKARSDGSVALAAGIALAATDAGSGEPSSFGLWSIEYIFEVAVATNVAGGCSEEGTLAGGSAALDAISAPVAASANDAPNAHRLQRVGASGQTFDRVRVNMS
jgi:hypothetical protein